MLSAAPFLHVHDSSGNLGVVDFTTGETAVIGDMGPAMTDIAFSPDGELYAITFSSLYSVDPSTAQSTLIGSHGVSGGNGLVFDEHGTLYAMGNGSTSLFVIDPTDASSAAIGSVGYSSAGDLAFVGDSLYLASGSDELVQIDLDNGVSSSVVGGFGVGNVFGLATPDNERLYATAGTNVYEVDLLTGVASLSTGFAGMGLGASNGTSFYSEAGGEAPGGTLRGVKFEDINGNGIRDRSLINGNPPRIVFVVDISGSTDETYDGDPVGDVNGDGLSNTRLDGELAAFLVLTQEIIDEGFGDIATVSIVTFSSNAGALVLDPDATDQQVALTPLTDADGDGVRDIAERLVEIVDDDNGTNFTRALQAALDTVEQVELDGSDPRDSNVVFISDGRNNPGNDPRPIAAAIRDRGTTLRAFGVGTDADLDELQEVDSEARLFATTDELLGIFSGLQSRTINFVEPGLAGWTIYLDENDNGVLDAGEQSTVTGEDGSYAFFGLSEGDYTVREVQQSGWTQTTPIGELLGTAHRVSIGPDGSVVDLDFGNRRVFSGPEITVTGRSVEIIDGSTTPMTADGTDFGPTRIDTPAISRTFNVRNDGDALLTLADLEVTGAFEIVEGLAAELAPGESDSFTVSFTGIDLGVFDGEVRLMANDPDEALTDFGIRASRTLKGFDLVVDTTDDIDNGDYSEGDRSLREMIRLANQSPGPDLVTFTSNVSGETIVLDSVGLGALLVSDAITIDASALESQVAIDGSGQSRLLLIDDPLNINDDFEVTLSHLGFTNGATNAMDGDGGAIRSRSVGLLEINSSIFVENRVLGNASQGGAVYASGPLVIRDSTFLRNSTHGQSGYGGAVYRQSTGGNDDDLQVYDSLFEDNATNGESAGGGAILAVGEVHIKDTHFSSNETHGLRSQGGAIGAFGSITVVSSAFVRNRTSGDLSHGGALSVFNSGPHDVVVESTEFVQNSTQGDGARGGAIYSPVGLDLVDSSVFGNRTEGERFADADAGVFSNAEGGGFMTFGNLRINGSTIASNWTAAMFASGGGFASVGPALVSNTTISNNETRGSSASGGGAIFFDPVTLSSSTIVYNRTLDPTSNGGGLRKTNVSGEVLSIANTVIAQNTSGGDGPDLSYGTSTVEIANSLVGTNEGTGLASANGLGSNGSLVGAESALIDPELASLADNGGPTPTHALLPGSPAINAGDPFIAFGPNEFDQRGEGFSRVVGGRIDIGAFEVQATLPLLPGDFDRNGVVDLADDQLWRNTYAAQVPLRSGADANGNGRIDAGDYTVWRDNYTPVDATIEHLIGSIQVDGFVDPVWSSVTAMPIDQQLLGFSEGPDDLAASWKLLWDEASLYVLAEVTDDQPFTDSIGSPFQDDGVELFLDVDYSRGGSYDGIDDTQLMLRLGDTVAYRGGNSIATTGVVYQTRQSGPSYTVEASIPWSSVGGRPAAGVPFGIDVAVQDDDDGGGANGQGPDGRIGWPDSRTRAFTDPSVFGTAVLADLPATGVLAQTSTSEDEGKTKYFEGLVAFDHGARHSWAQDDHQPRHLASPEQSLSEVRERAELLIERDCPQMRPHTPSGSALTDGDEREELSVSSSRSRAGGLDEAFASIGSERPGYRPVKRS